jgi:predicted dehydrogenase
VSITSPKTIRRVAVVGAGFFSQFHLDGWRQIPGIEIVGLCDPDLPKAQALANRFNIHQVYTSLETMLAQACPDLVDVVTPASSQSALLAVLLPYKRPVICQKPFGTRYEQALAFTEAAEALSTDLIIHENFRFMPWHRELKRLIQSDFFGALHSVSFRLRPGDGQGPNAYLDRQPYFQTMPRLLIAETGVHIIDTFRYLMGEVSAVYARLRKINPVIAGEDAGLVCFEFENGSSGLFDGNRLNDHVADNPRRTMGEMWLEGANGVMRLDGFARLWWKPHHGHELEHVYDANIQDASFGAGACGALQRRVVEQLALSRPIENTARSYLRNLLVQEAIYASDQTGQRIDMKNFETALSTNQKETT